MANINKMLSKKPLEDEDRRKWLLAIEDDIRRAKNLNSEAVITCSCLKSSYRRRLASLGQVQLVWLSVPEAELAQRLDTRENHFMKSEMLKSQLAAFEPIGSEEHVLVVNGVYAPRQIVDELMGKATQMFPGLNTSWWQRCTSITPGNNLLE